MQEGWKSRYTVRRRWLSTPYLRYAVFSAKGRFLVHSSFSRVLYSLRHECVALRPPVLMLGGPTTATDVQLTLAQTVPLAGAILVTPPQDLALLDVIRGAEMFKQVKTPLLGIVENMSYFVCPECGKETEVFRQGGGQKESRRLGIPLLGTIPLDPVVCDAGDTGVPLVLSQPNTKTAQEMHKVAAAVSEILGRHAAPAPIKTLN